MKENGFIRLGKRWRKTLKYLAYNKIIEECRIISIDDTWIWPNPINVQWDGIIGFKSYPNWASLREEWNIIAVSEN